MPRRTTVALLATLASLAAASPAEAVSARAAVTACPSAASSPTRGTVEQATRTTLCLVNLERTSRGLRRLRDHNRLERAADRHSRDMVRRDFFSHVSLGGTTMLERIRRAGYLRRANGYSLGENIAWGTGSLGSPLKIVRGWMNSPGHRHNMLNPRFEELGVGVAIGAPGRPGGATYTTNFGARG